MTEESATPDPVALTHRVYEALSARDLEVVAGLLGPASVVDVSRWDLGTHTGLEAIRRFGKGWLGSLHEYSVRVEDMQDLGNGVVYVAQVAHRAATSHGYLELESALAFVWVDGKIARVTLYSDPADARAAAELLARERG